MPILYTKTVCEATCRQLALDEIATNGFANFRRIASNKLAIVQTDNNGDRRLVTVNVAVARVDEEQDADAQLDALATEYEAKVQEKLTASEEKERAKQEKIERDKAARAKKAAELAAKRPSAKA